MQLAFNECLMASWLSGRWPGNLSPQLALGFQEFRDHVCLGAEELLDGYLLN